VNYTGGILQASDFRPNQENAMALSKLLSPEQLSELFDLPLGTIYRWNYAKTGPPVLRIGRHVRYRETDVEAWLDEQALEQGRGRPRSA